MAGVWDPHFTGGETEIHPAYSHSQGHVVKKWQRPDQHSEFSLWSRRSKSPGLCFVAECGWEGVPDQISPGECIAGREP